MSESEKSESGKLDIILRELEKINTGLQPNKDIDSQIILRLINISTEVRAISSRIDIIDYNTQWTREEITRKEV